MSIKSKLLSIYGKYMHLKLFLDNDDIELQKAYVIAVKLHNDKLGYHPDIIDAGFDILTVANDILLKPFANKVDFNIICACKMVYKNDVSYNTGFYMYPRSSISKSPLRLANNVGIIDAGYRGHLIGMFDLVDDHTQHIKKFDKYLQICAPGLVPIFVELVNSKDELGEDTPRGDRGFGSTGSIFGKG
jgi:dUTP pyrophosphatase